MEPKNEDKSELNRWSSPIAGMPDLVLMLVKIPPMSRSDTYTIEKGYYFDDKEYSMRKATLSEAMLFFLLGKA